jgi:hypothetical protein
MEGQRKGGGGGAGLAAAREEAARSGPRKERRAAEGGGMVGRARGLRIGLAMGKRAGGQARVPSQRETRDQFARPGRGAEWAAAVVDVQGTGGQSLHSP